MRNCALHRDKLKNFFSFFCIAIRLAIFCAIVFGAKVIKKKILLETLKGEHTPMLQH